MPRLHRLRITAPVVATALGLLGASCASAPSAPPPAPPPSVPTTSPVPPLPPLPTESVPLGPLPSDIRPTHESLSLAIDPEAERFGGTASIDVALDHPRDVLWLHGRGLTVQSIDVALPGGEHVAAAWKDADPSGVARVTLAHPIAGNATLSIRYDAPYDSSLVGVYRTATGAGHAVFSKFEAIYARRAFPCFDEPSFKIPFDITLTVPKGAVALGNMPAQSTTEADGKQVVTFAPTPPLPTYLVAFAVGPFASQSGNVAPSTLRAAPLPFDVVALKGREEETAFAMSEGPALVAEEERYYGVAFPFPKLDLLAVPDFQSGAMENAGLITFRDSALLASPKSSTLGDRMRILQVVAHEAAHQWFGDLVTMRWWDDLWLNESFATFIAARTLHAVKPELEPELAEIRSTDGIMNADGLASTRRIRQPIANTDDITNAFDNITYQKGEAVLSMVEHFIGEEPFRRGLHDYLTAHAGGNATTNDLVGALSRSSGRDLAPLFASFLDQAGVPLVAVHAKCDHGSGSVTLEQSRWLPFGSAASKDVSWTVPVCMRASIAGKVTDRCTVLDSRTAEVPLSGCADWVMPNADARGYYRFTLDAGDLAHLRDRGAKALSTAERMAFAGDLDAAFHSASLSSSDVLHAVEPLARDAHGAVATMPLGLYRFVADSTLDDASRAKFRAYVRGLYAPAVRSLGWRVAKDEPTSRSLERTDLLTFLARRMDDPTVLAEGARLGRAYLGLGEGATPAKGAHGETGGLHPEAVEPDLAGLAVASAVRQANGDARVFDAVLDAFVKSNDAAKRRSFLVALASTRDPGLAARALDLSLDPRLKKTERLYTLGTLLDGASTRDLAWAWVVAHFDALAPMLPDRYAGTLPPAVHYCDAKKADEVNAFFAPRVPSMTGGTRNLAQAVEGMKSCAALADTQRESAKGFVKKL